MERRGGVPATLLELFAAATGTGIVASDFGCWRRDSWVHLAGEIDDLDRRRSVREDRLALVVCDGEIALPDDVHADEDVVGRQIAFRDAKGCESHTVGQSNVD